MVDFEVSTNSLGDVARMLQSAIATFDVQLDNVQGTVNRIVNQSWQGTDADLFDSSFQDWYNSAVGVRSVLETLALTLVAAENGYESTESALDKNFDATATALAPKPAVATATSMPTKVVA
jgi:WXG100 family type VII secretion target